MRDYTSIYFLVSEKEQCRIYRKSPNVLFFDCFFNRKPVSLLARNDAVKIPTKRVREQPPAHVNILYGLLCVIH